MSKVELIDFNVIDESWNEFSLPDNLRLKVKVNLIGVFRKTDDNDDIEYRFKQNHFYNIFKDNNLIGSASGKFTRDEKINSIEHTIPLEKELIPQIYQFDNKKCHIIYKINKLCRTSLHDDLIPTYYSYINLEKHFFPD